MMSVSVPVPVLMAVAGLLLLALQLVLDGVGQRDTGCTAKKGLELASVAHLVADGATGTAADHRGH